MSFNTVVWASYDKRTTGLEKAKRRAARKAKQEEVSGNGGVVVLQDERASLLPISRERDDRTKEKQQDKRDTVLSIFGE